MDLSNPENAMDARKNNLESFLKDLGLDQHYREKLSLQNILQIDKKTIDDEPAKCKSQLPWYFLKKLMLVNVTARNVKYESESMSNDDDSSELTEFDFNDLFDVANSEDMVNPLDVITALFLCSDGFVQQKMALKMSMCQFPVPLLLPSCDSQQCTLMLWAMRDIVKQYRPEALSESKDFTEERIVLSNLPMVSFVRLGECSMSKSETLNKLLSNSQQYHNIFVHRNMECGDSPRRISNGLTEITWYLPCGNKNIDIFSQPVAVANLRGDIGFFETQYAFLCQTSVAVFIFFDDFGTLHNLLTKEHHKTQIFLVCNLGNKCPDVTLLNQVTKPLGLTKNKLIFKKNQENDANFVKRLKEAVCKVISKIEGKISIEQMADIAHELGIWVDEDSHECQTAKKHADAITKEIKDTLSFKEQQLPLQGQIWKELTSLEKEEFRLQKLGSENIEKYKSDLKEKKDTLRQKQNSYDISNSMESFINALSLPQLERNYFLKWKQISLEDVSRTKQSGLRELYEEKRKSSENKEEIKQLDQQLTNSSLGTEHFFREMGQIYEASRFLPETDPSRQQLNHLPGLCAQLLLDGFPLELVDGDASNIPLQWVSDVLSQLNEMVSPKNKILVVTVLGVQSTGKSTLLNTMFGVQFAVSSGRCTRGAFMLLIKVHEEFKKVLACDFIVIIDTEGLKSSVHAQIDSNYEHDNELATLVVGLSDISILNVSMENLSDMKDILQIVVHAFLRMKEVGKKPKCLFVHQNVSDVSANRKNVQARDNLLQMLNKLTQTVAKIERKEENMSFIDIMEYNPDTGNSYIPGLWNGNPPMAPVNIGYSEAIYELKKSLIQPVNDVDICTNSIWEFEEWLKSLWHAVKHENFLFSFRNSLVADAYMRLCAEFNKWEWEFKKEIYIWSTNAETKISSFGTVASKSQSTEISDLVTSLKKEATALLFEWENKTLDNLTQYFSQTEEHVCLITGYQEAFENQAKNLRHNLENSLHVQLRTAADFRKGMIEIDQIKENHHKEIEKSVCALLEKCWGKKVQMSDKDLDEEFNKMWKETVEDLSFPEIKATDVFNNVNHHLRDNLSQKGSHANQLMNKRLEECGLVPFHYTPKGFVRKLEYQAQALFTHKKHNVQQKADVITAECYMFIREKIKDKKRYHETWIIEILHIIERGLQSSDVKTDVDFEVLLKQHICGYAARRFQKNEQDFINANDPYQCLNQHKDKLCADFKGLFHKQEQCKPKAEEFADKCLKPAVESFVQHDLGLRLTDEMMKCKEFSTRIEFHYSILLDFLSRNDFEDYLSYCKSYETCVKQWTLQQVKKHFPSSTIFELEDQLLQSSISSINDAIQKARKETDDLKSFAKSICKELGDKLVISQDALGAFMIMNNANKEQFADSLTKCLKDIKQDLSDKFLETDSQTKLEDLHIKPQNELFRRVIGCGRQCPFCGVPCVAGGNAHTEHLASLHRPQGLIGTRWNKTQKLNTDICSTSVTSDSRFCCEETNSQWLLSKNYREIYPDWKISPDVSHKASDYWKYVMTKYTKDFAKAYKAKPADIPISWREITKKQAEESLKLAFGIQIKDKRRQWRLN
ncbi:up-regulator of cell proliferation-like isoform X3 [Gouania willdenowi]|uniref:up-regulator of cell proliferation-like isoform X2 n=1 Tax=Gouania willdenowi TaxID=441366 RepID=UPI00105610B5|nr:up-regulator of cell proliferation-like isoform X2 [Gouania willdenowi]XP_028330774.1 up-regulator of cell proliferation-like isoform X3 [Gouania willdenowi]